MNFLSNIRPSFLNVIRNLISPSYKSKVPEFDPDFYKYYYKDADLLQSDSEIVSHYLKHGRREGRFPNAATLIQRLEAEHGPLPDNFVPSEYRLMHNDLSSLHKPWELKEHYLRFGRKESRGYQVGILNLEKELQEFPDSDTSEFDHKFYRSYYKDTCIIDTDSELLKHYIQHGRPEGRFPNAAILIQSLEAVHGRLPDDFMPVEYKLRHNDLSSLHEPWELTEHYLRFGREEKRAYQIDISHLEEEYKELLRSTSFIKTYSSSVNVPQSFRDLLQLAGIKPTIWIDRFNLYEFTLLNAHWLPRRPFSRMDGIYLFLVHGIERLAPIALGEEFEPAFYRQQSSDTLAAVNDADLFRNWLSSGLVFGLQNNERKALLASLDIAEFPPCFDEQRYRAAIDKSGRHPAPGRYNALMHYVTVGFAIHDVELLTREKATVLIERIAEYHLARTNLKVALKAFDRAISLSPGVGRLHHKRGDCLASLGCLEQATESFQEACNLPGFILWSHINAAEGLAKNAAQLERAVERIQTSATTCHGSPAWRAVAHSIIERLFHAASNEALALYRKGLREDADALVEIALDRTVDLIRTCNPLPGKLIRRATGHVVLIANQDLPQCNYYRVQQRERQLIAGGWSVEVINQRNMSCAHSAIDRASAVIFYRVAASPALLHAILYARALGAVTIYDIDDLIFDAKHYPEPLETYEGQISEDEYLGLQSGVPLFRYAIKECDIGLTSTTVLADYLRPLVRRQQCQVLRNGLDERNNRFLAYPRRSFSEAFVTLFYGSGTKAHKQDFNTIIVPALLDLFSANTNVRLAVAGYVSLDSRFDVYSDRILRLGFNADVLSYWEVLSGADINISVLSSNPATDAKSEIKWLEAAMFCIPSIVSPTATYREVLVDGEDVIFATTSVNWTEMLIRLVADAELRSRIGGQARIKASEHYGLPAAVKILKLVVPQRDKSLPSLPFTPIFDELPSFHKPPKRERDIKNRFNRKRRVLIVNVYFPPHTFGGATRVVRDNVDYYIDHASDLFDISVLSSDHNSSATYETRVDCYRGMPVFRVGVPNERNMDWRPFNDAIAPAIETLMRQFDPDLVHFHCIQRLTGTAVEVAARLGVPYIITCHDAWWISDFQFLIDEDGELHVPSPDPLLDRHSRSFPALISVARRRRLGRLLEGAERVICVSESFSNIYRDAGVQNVQSIPNGMPALKDIKARQPSMSGRVRLGHIGGRTTHKGATLIEAALRQHAFPNLELTLVDHARAEGDAEIEIWGETQVTIVGFMPQDKVAKLYAKLDVLLAPSIWPESFGLVTREAVACGLWVVASDRGAIGEDVEEGINGFTVDVSSIDGIVRVFKEINENTTKYLGCREIVSNRIRTVADQCRETLAIYREILSC